MDMIYIHRLNDLFSHPLNLIILVLYILFQIKTLSFLCLKVDPYRLGVFLSTSMNSYLFTYFKDNRSQGSYNVIHKTLPFIKTKDFIK